MKVWFKHKYGFVNIDENNLFLTNTGNWSEIENIDEKNSVSKKANSFKKNWFYFFLAVVAILALVLFLTNLASSKISMLLLIGVPLGAFKVYQYMRSELGSAYKIPLEKVKSISIDEKNAIIEFMNGDDILDQEEMKEIEMKGIEILKEMKISLISISSTQ